MSKHDEQNLNLLFEQTGPIYFTENRNFDEKREFPIKITMNNKVVFTGAVFDGDYYNLVHEDREYPLEEVMEQIFRVQDFWQMKECDQIQQCYLSFVKSVYQHGDDVLHGKAPWDDFNKLSEEICHLVLK